MTFGDSFCASWDMRVKKVVATECAQDTVFNEYVEQRYCFGAFDDICK